MPEAGFDPTGLGLAPDTLQTDWATITRLPVTRPSAAHTCLESH